jgi:hypothetical protein
LYICIPEKEELAGGDSRGWVFTGAGETRESWASGKAGRWGKLNKGNFSVVGRVEIDGRRELKELSWEEGKMWEKGAERAEWEEGKMWEQGRADVREAGEKSSGGKKLGGRGRKRMGCGPAGGHA